MPPEKHTSNGNGFLVLLLVCVALSCSYPSHVCAKSSHSQPAQEPVIEVPNLQYLLPVVFLENKAAFPADTPYVRLCQWTNLFLGTSGPLFELLTHVDEPPSMQPILRASLAGAGPSTPVASDLFASFHLYRGRQPSAWYDNVPAYSTIAYSGIYPGIDLTLKGAPLSITCLLTVQPGVSVESIGVFLEGDLASVAVLPSGELEVAISFYDYALTEAPPTAYQLTPSGRQDLPASIVLREPTLYGYEVAGADPSLPLFLELTPLWARTGAGGPFDYNCNCIDRSPDGSTIIAGEERGWQFPFLGDPYSPRLEQKCAFAVALTSDLKLLWCTILDGVDGGDVEADDQLKGMAVGADGRIWITGESHAYDYPPLNAFSDTHHGTNTGDCFVSRLSPTGLLEFSSYLGGSGHDVAYDIDVDKRGNAWLTGFSGSHDFPTPGGGAPHVPSGNRDVFVAKITPSNVHEWGCCFGGGGTDTGYGIAVDRSFNVWLTGTTYSSDFPIVKGFDRLFERREAFVARLTQKRGLTWSSFLGGSDNESGRDIMLDRPGTIWLSGFTSSLDFPVKRGLGPDVTGGGYDGFVARVSRGGRLMFSSRLGGDGGDEAYALSADKRGNVYVTGSTTSSFFTGPRGSLIPVTGAAWTAKLSHSGVIRWTCFTTPANESWCPQGIIVPEEDTAWIACGSLE